MNSRRRIFWVALLIGIFYAVFGNTFGLSDDEAYYWALAQHPSWGFAFHPPAIVWSIWLCERVFSASVSVRIVAGFYSAIIFYLGLSWVAVATRRFKIKRALLAWLSVSFVFGFSWMAVPDLPLFAGILLTLKSTWIILFARPRRRDGLGLMFGTALALLAKFSGAAVIFSALLSLLYFGKRHKVEMKKALYYLFLGVVIGIIPVLVWNLQHDWGSFLYQYRERHSHAGLSWLRYLKFWLIQLVVLGPIMVYYIIKKISDGSRRTIFIWIWALPPLVVFGLQPLVSDFKPHWAFAAWLPLSLGWVCAVAEGRFPRTRAIQFAYGFLISAFILISCELPIFPWLSEKISGKPSEPKWDVSNDLYGWRDLPEMIKARMGEQALALPVIGSRYQTAGQAAYALRGISRVTHIPRSKKEWDEWPDLKLSDGVGPSWPMINQQVLYVGDSRYNEPPQFPGANCKLMAENRVERWGYEAKRIFLWICDPK